MDYKDGWVPRLQSLIDTQHPGWTIINASVSGETTGGALARLPRLLEEHQPDILWIELGGNDGLRGYPPPSIKANLLQMIDLATQAKAAVWLTQIKIPPNYGPRYTQSFEANYTQLADERTLPLIPFILTPVALKPELIMADGIHPKVEAQAQIADYVFEQIKDRLTMEPASPL